MNTTVTMNQLHALYLCVNYDDRENQLSDNYSNAGIEEFANEIFSGNRQAAGGLVTSMENAGLGFMDEDDDIFWMSEQGVNTLFDYLDKYIPHF